MSLVLGGAILARRTLPQISGTVHIPGLHGPVTVARDRWGVPHIYAGNTPDLFVAQGYVTAQDRLWQILLRRQASRGQLSAWMGSHAASVDEVLGRQGFYAQVASAPPDSLAEGYALGVNACIMTCPAPPELSLLRSQGKSNQVDPWTASDSAALLRMVNWAQGQGASTGLREELLARLGPERAADLWPDPVALPGPTLPLDPATRQALQRVGIPKQTGGDMSPAILQAPPGLPAAWYVVSLHSERYTVTGATWPGLPDVMIQRLGAPTAEPQRKLVAYLLALPPEGWLQVRVHGMLRQWNYDLSDPSRLSNASAAVYQVWVWHLARDTFQDELGPDLFTRYWATGLAPQTLARLAEKPDNPWWDDVTTPQRDAASKRDDIMRRAYAEALGYLGRHYGDLHTIWEWDAMHAAQLRHPLDDAWPRSLWLDRTVKLGGDAPFDPARPDDPLNAYAPVLISSLRINEQSFALAGGQSGNPFSPHYADLLPLWARGQSVPLQDAARPQDLKDVDGILVLTP